jgi:rSAM/selenodomain-associated transferase 1
MIETVIGTVIVIAKEPVAGRVKTRLVPELTFSQAAEVAAAALADTLAVASRFPCHRRVIALDGRPGPWLPEGWDVVPQVDGDLDARLVGAFQSAGARSALLIGMDTPQLELRHLRAADLEEFDACIGLSTDGGYWSIGFRDARLADAVISGVAMSTDRTGADQLGRLVEAGLRVQLLDQLTDVDTIEDARDVAQAAPWTRFAAAVDQVLGRSRVVA